MCYKNLELLVSGIQLSSSWLVFNTVTIDVPDGNRICEVIYNKRESVYYRRIKHRKVC